VRAASARGTGIFRAAAVAGLLAAMGAAGSARIFAAAVRAGDVSGALQTAQRQFNAGNYSAAITTLQSAVQQSPASAEAFFWLGRSYYELHDYDNAIAQLEKSTQLDAKNSEYHHWLGIAYGEKADREHSYFVAKKVKKEFQEAVQLNPSNIQARRDLMEFDVDAPWIVGGSKDEAKQQIEAIQKLDPIEGRLAQAMFYRAEKKPDLAEKEYRDVLAAKPKKIEAYFEVANFFARQNKAPEMQAAIDAAAQISPNDPRLAYYRGVQRVLSGADLGHGEEYLKAYLASTPDRSDWPPHAFARDWLGRLYQQEGKRTEAAEQYRAALQLDPTMKDTKSRLEQLEKKGK
jgi:tetratricopeptide (TPR) repeat protein